MLTTNADRPDVEPSSRRAGIALAGVLALAALIVLVPAGRRVFWSSDEARLAILAQDILEHGRWLVPELRGKPYLNKPQLQFWAIAVLSLPSGRVTEFTAALPAVLSAVGTVGAVAAIGKLRWGWPAGLLAGLILATAPPFFAFGHVALPDMMMTCWMTWSLYWLLRARRSEWAAGPLAGFYLCVGLAVASKGPAGYAALGGALAAVLGIEGFRGLRRLRPILGLAVLALCAAPWLVSYHLQSRGHFEGDVLVGHYGSWFFRGGVLSRFARPVDALTGFLPWTILLAGAPWWWRRAPDPSRRLLGLWTLAIWLLISFSGTSRARYFLPLYPLFALLTAEFLARAGSRHGGAAARSAAAVLAIGALGAAAGMGLLSPRVLGREDSAFFPESLRERSLAAGIMLVAGAAAWILARRGAFRAMTATVALALAGLLVLTGITYPPRYTRDNDPSPLAAAAAGHTEPGAAVVAYPDLRLSYDFYLRRPVVELVQHREMRDLLGALPRQALITSADRWRDLAPLALPAWRVLSSRTVAGRQMVVVGRP